MLLLTILILSAAMPLSSAYISSALFNRLAILVLLYSSVLAFNSLYLEPLAVGVAIYGGVSQVTLLSQSFDSFILASGSIILLVAAGSQPLFGQLASSYEGIPKDRVGEFPLIILFTTLGMSCLVSSSDLLTLFLSIELLSLPLYILATIFRDSEGATSAGLKYLLLGALSSSLILLGSSLLYGLTGVTSFEGVYLVSSIPVANTPIYLALVIIGIALLFKVAAAPFHNWAPDVYDGVPTIVTTWLAIMPKVAILGFLAEYQGFTHLGGLNDTGYPIWANILLVTALISLVIGGLVGVAQYRIKRLIAYSAISHIGFMLLALAIHTAEGIEAFLFYLVQYVVTSSNIFFVLLAFGNHPYPTPSPSHSPLRSKGPTRPDQAVPPTATSTFPYFRYPFDNGAVGAYSPTQNQSISHISRYSNIHSNPPLALSLGISLFSMAGIPPMVGFFGKWLVLYSATQSGYFLLPSIAILVSVISAGYYLRVIRVIFFDTPQFTDSRTPFAPGLLGSPVRANGNNSMVIATITLLIILFIAKGNVLLNALHLLALSLFYW
jgi:NADH-ubiquinone oxidoreductase chain 2